MHVAASDDRDDVLRTDAYLTRHHYRWGWVRQVVEAGFELVPSFTDPHHFTVILEPYTASRVEELLAAMPHRETNPHHGGRTQR